MMKRVKKGRFLIFGCVIGLIIALLFLLRRCDGNDEAFFVPKTQEDILQIMKNDEEQLHQLYRSSNVCDKKWIEEYREIGKRFQVYNYLGDDPRIHRLLKEYVGYGKQIEEIAIIINEENYESGVEQLEKLKNTAKINESKLQELYDENH